MYLWAAEGDADGIRCAAAQGVSRWESSGFVTKRTASPLCSNVSNRVFPQAAVLPEFASRLLTGGDGCAAGLLQTLSYVLPLLGGATKRNTFTSAGQSQLRVSSHQGEKPDLQAVA